MSFSMSRIICREKGDILGLCITHGGGAISVYRAEVSVAVHQHVSGGEVLGQPHHGVVNRAVAMRVVFTHNLTDDTGRFLRFVRRYAQLAHAVQILRCTGFMPSLTSGRARPTMTPHGVVDVGLFSSLWIFHVVPVLYLLTMCLKISPSFLKCQARPAASFSSMNFFRGGTLSPMRIVKISSAAAASSMVIWIRVRLL